MNANEFTLEQITEMARKIEQWTNWEDGRLEGALGVPESKKVMEFHLQKKDNETYAVNVKFGEKVIASYEGKDGKVVYDAAYEKAEENRKMVEDMIRADKEREEARKRAIEERKQRKEMPVLTRVQEIRFALGKGQEASALSELTWDEVEGLIKLVPEWKKKQRRSFADVFSGDGAGPFYESYEGKLQLDGLKDEVKIRSWKKYGSIVLDLKFRANISYKGKDIWTGMVYTAEKAHNLIAENEESRRHEAQARMEREIAAKREQEEQKQLEAFKRQYLGEKK